MERSGALRWLLLGLAALLMVTFIPKLFSSEGKTQPLQAELVKKPAARQPERLCDIWGPGFRAQLGTHGASLKHFYPLGAKYSTHGKPIDLSTTANQEFRRTSCRKF